MATALHGFRLTVRSCQCRPIAYRCATRSIGRRRAFSTTLLRRKDDQGDADRAFARMEDILRRAESLERSLDSGRKVDPDETFARLGIDKSDLPELPEWMNQELDGQISETAKKDIKTGEQKMMDDPDVNQKMVDLASNVTPFPEPSGRKKLKQTFLNMGEPEPFEDEDFVAHEDVHEDLSSLAHGELERHREMRYYARLAAWDMPLLSKMAKPFVPPTADMPLRFRYTTYMGEQHPAEKKVVLEFTTADMPNLTKIQREKLMKLVGVRYNPETDIVKMSCEMFETQAQNKRYLGDVVDDLLKEARDPTDTFEDVPLDTRHHKFKPKPKFPKEWALTEARRAELARYRADAEQRDQKLLLEGQLVDGIQQIEAALAKPPAEREALPEMVMAGGKAAQKGKGRRLTVRR